MLSEHGRSSPSFIIAVVLVILGVGGYVAWSYFQPNPHKVSEQIVRECRRTFSRQVRAYQRALKPMTSKGKTESEETAALIDKRAAEGIARIEADAETAHDKLTELDIALNTYRNRTSRVTAKAEEAKEMIADLAEEAKAKLRGE